MFDYKQKLNHSQKVLTKGQYDKLVANFHANENGDKDFKPVVKFFGGSSATWLISELNPETGVAFGLCDPGLGFPELGAVSLDELISVKFPPFGTRVERDLHFKATKTLGEYSDEARVNERILA